MKIIEKFFDRYVVTPLYKKINKPLVKSDNSELEKAMLTQLEATNKIIELLRK